MTVNEKKIGLISKSTSMFFRGIAILMVILSHFFEWGAQNAGSEKLAGFMASLGDWGVGIFFFMSGYAIYKGYGIKNTDLSFILKRLKNTYIPYILIAGVIAIIGKTLTDFKSVVRLLIGGDYWFIVEILIIYAVFYLVGKLPYRYRVLIMSVFVVDLSLFFLVLGYQDFWYTATWPFAVGMILSKYEIRIRAVRQGFGINIKDWVFGFLGKLSLYIYVLHGFIYYRVMDLGILEGMNWYVKLIISIFITVAISFVLELILTKIYGLFENRSSKEKKNE